MKRPLHLFVSPLRTAVAWAGLTSPAPIVLVLIIDPERAPRGVESNLRALFELTPAEARVARGIAAGETLIGVAEALGILSSTARTHLHRVFEKTGTKRQAELVKLTDRIVVR
jgi:DNA-binding CsgD family transcriptional regulator